MKTSAVLNHVGLGEKEKQPMVQLLQGLDTSHTRDFAFNAIIQTGTLRSRAEMKTMLATIDRELEKHRSIAELDFTAGYLTGKIYEKESSELLTKRQAEQLKNILYAKYEAIRTLEEQMKCEKG